MAGDWVKMRVLLPRDPKVIRMADHLAAARTFIDWITSPVQQQCEKSAYEHVTRNVTRALCVTGLLQTWGLARDRGTRLDNDLVLSCCNLTTIDDMADLPGFGAAMASVGWVTEHDDDSCVFPNFFEQIELGESRYREVNRERQARYRQNKKVKDNVTPIISTNVTDNVISNVTPNVTFDRVEKSREEENREENKNKSVVDGVGVKGKPRARKPATQTTIIPAVLDTPEFRAAWADWNTYRSQMKKPLSEMTAEHQLKHLEKSGVGKAVVIIRQSIRNGWQGLFEPKEQVNGHGPEAIGVLTLNAFGGPRE